MTIYLLSNFGISILDYPIYIYIYLYIYIYEPFGLGRFATDHSLTKAASRSLFARYSLGQLKNHI